MLNILHDDKKSLLSKFIQLLRIIMNLIEKSIRNKNTHFGYTINACASKIDK